MAVTPTANLTLIGLSKMLSPKHQIKFNSVAEQNTFFWSQRPIKYIEDFTYIRKNSTLRIPENIDNLVEYNYCFYDNEEYTDKRYFCYITDMRYINDNMTEIDIVEDVYQTWHLFADFKECFVEREHESNYQPNGNYREINTYPENLEMGEIGHLGITGYSSIFTPLAVIAYQRNPKTDGYYTGSSAVQSFPELNGIGTGLYYCVMSMKFVGGQLYQMREHSDSILNIFTIPSLAMNGYQFEDGSTWNASTNNDFPATWLVSNFKAIPVDLTIPDFAPTRITDTPVSQINNKMWIYPYRYLTLNLPSGQSKILRYENFGNSGEAGENKKQIRIFSEINPNPTICFVPLNYNNLSKTAISQPNLIESLDEMTTCSGYPTLSWLKDFFNTWVAQNSEIIQLNMDQERMNYNWDIVNSMVSGVDTGIQAIVQNQYNDNKNLSALGNFATTFTSMLQRSQNYDYYIKNQLAQITKQSMLPNQGSQGANGTTLLGYETIGNNLFTVYSIKKEYFDRINKYFTVYGYTVNKFKIPNTDNRPNWNYLKTVDALLEGDVPEYAISGLEALYNNGITLWHNPATFMDYTQNNMN